MPKSSARAPAKRDRSKKGADGLNKDERYRSKKQKANSSAGVLKKSPGSNEHPSTRSTPNFTEAQPIRQSRDETADMVDNMRPSSDQLAANNILQILRATSHPYALCESIDCEEFTELRRFAAIESQVISWCSAWGGMTNWMAHLELTYAEARRSKSKDRWYEAVWKHADNGRQLQARLFAMYGALPKEDFRVKELFRREVELVHILAKGITQIEILVPLIPHSHSLVEEELLSPLPPSSPPAMTPQHSEDSLADYS